jgi:hypothetical protein
MLPGMRIRLDKYHANCGFDRLADRGSCGRREYNPPSRRGCEIPHGLGINAGPSLSGMENRSIYFRRLVRLRAYLDHRIRV